MPTERRALRFACGEHWLLGILDVPSVPSSRGVLIVTGGPQYRIGSHRQFTLLARSLAEAGVPAMRFDYRGMGDSEGGQRSFEQIEADLRAAIDAMCDALPQLNEVVLWGLCDAASAALLYAPGDARVSALALLNPWARTAAGLAQATLKHYYRARLLDPGLWRKIAMGRFDARAALRSLIALAARALGRSPDNDNAPLPQRLYDALARFDGPLLLITSDSDLTAQEFLDIASAPRWRALLAQKRLTHHRLGEADHTFSRQAWREQVASWTATWLGH